jgi:5-methylcytosine-specific restriction endonuclease McrA
LASSQSDRSVLIGKYFRAANGPEVLSWDGNKFKRDVSGSLRKRVLARDGHQCVICASTYDLEVDHRRALMNGGDNKMTNLATLCHECHVAKTKMDNSLRRKRDRLYNR